MRRKTKKAVAKLDLLLDHLTNKKIYRDYNFQSLDEFYMRIPLNEALKIALKDLFREQHPSYLDRTIQRKVEKALVWEGNPTKSITPTTLFGVTHRPDFVIEIGSMRVAIEIKISDSGSSIRSGLGQAMVYSTDYDFVICLFIDTSSDGEISKSVNYEIENHLIRTLWIDHNIRFVFV